MGWSIAMVRRVLQELKAIQAIVVWQVFTDNGRQSSNSYQLNFAPPPCSPVSTPLLTREHPPAQTFEQQNHTQVPTPIYPNESPSPSELIPQSATLVDHHHQPQAAVLDDDAQPFNENEKLETCHGPHEEPVEYAHSTKRAVAQHLELFLAHSFAHKLLKQYGVARVNQALAELPSQRGLKNEAGWLNTRVQAIRGGSGKVSRPVPARRQPAADLSEHEIERLRIQSWSQEYTQVHGCSRDEATRAANDFAHRKGFAPWEAPEFVAAHPEGWKVCLATAP
jgi:hypothetical protein